VHHVVDDTTSTGTLCGGCHGQHWYTMCWMTWRALVHIDMSAVASTGTLFVVLDDDDVAAPRLLTRHSVSTSHSALIVNATGDCGMISYLPAQWFTMITKLVAMSGAASLALRLR